MNDETDLRMEVGRRWQSLISRASTREDAHAWALPYIEGDLGNRADAPTLSALYWLHGVSMKNNDGSYKHSIDDLALNYRRWLAACEMYDADPGRYHHEMSRRPPDPDRNPWLWNC
jgi:hypothetical protein